MAEDNCTRTSGIIHRGTACLHLLVVTCQHSWSFLSVIIPACRSSRTIKGGKKNSGSSLLFRHTQEGSHVGIRNHHLNIIWTVAQKRIWILWGKWSNTWKAHPLPASSKSHSLLPLWARCIHDQELLSSIEQTNKQTSNFSAPLIDLPKFLPFFPLKKEEKMGHRGPSLINGVTGTRVASSRSPCRPIWNSRIPLVHRWVGFLWWKLLSFFLFC